MKTTSTFALLCCMVALLSLSLQTQPASAGFTSLDIWPTGYDAGWYEDINVDPLSGNATAYLEEHYDLALGDSYSIVVDGSTDTDPILSITKEVLNGSAFTWLGYEISLETSGGATFVGTPTSVGMTYDSGASDSDYLLFGMPAPVPSGSTVSFTFDINITSIGDFEFTLTQSPIIPEPATFALLGTGMLLIAAARRKRSL